MINDSTLTILYDLANYFAAASCILMALIAFTDLINMSALAHFTIANLVLALIGGILYKMD